MNMQLKNYSKGKWVILFAFMFLNSNFIFSQFIKEINEPKVQKNSFKEKIMDHAKKDKYLKKLRFLKIDKISENIKNDSLTFILPGLGKIIAVTSNLEYNSDNDYKWVGQIDTKNHYGDFYLFNENGNIYGHININNTKYDIKALGDGESILSELDKAKLPKEDCGGVVIKNENKILKASSRGIEPCTEVDGIKVLVVYDDLAESIYGVSSLREKVNLDIAKFNSLRSVSGVSNNRSFLQLVGFEKTSFQFTRDQHQFDVQTNLPNIVETRRVALNADIVVCITADVYQGINGVAGGRNAEYNQAYAIVEGHAMPGSTFSHEIGHLLGGDHHDRTSEGGNHYAHLYTYNHGLFGWGIKRNKTIMAGRTAEWDGNDKYSQQFRWSNPNVFHSGARTGTVNSNNVAQNISNNTSRIADLRPTPNTTLVARIIGTSYISSFGYYTYETGVSCGLGPYSYKWEESSNGFSYWTVSNSGNYSFYYYPTTQTRKYLRLTVTSADGQQVTTHLTISLYNEYPIYIQSKKEDNNPKPQISIENNHSLSEYLDTNFENGIFSVIYPNPTNGALNVIIDVQKSTNVSLNLFNLQGQLVQQIFNGYAPKGKNTYESNITNLSTGIYFVQLKTQDVQESHKVILQK